MTPKRKRTEKEKEKDDDDAVGFHPDFVEPTNDDRKLALGDFPLDQRRPAALWNKHPATALEDLNDPVLYNHQQCTTSNKKAQKPPPTIPKPTFELDWLAQVPEEGQTVSEFVQFLTTKKSGRLLPIANGSGLTICLLPIVSAKGDRKWPSEAPCLETLAILTKAFFSRPVKILEPATVSTTIGGSGGGGKSSKNKSKNKNVKFGIQFYDQQQKGRSQPVFSSQEVKGRYDPKTERSQYQVASILDQLHVYRSQYYGKEENFCIMGVSIEDIYDGDGDDDLFCAGMAFGGDKVAMFSFHRYHPKIRMSPLTWWDFGYQTRIGYDSYFEADGTGKPKSLLPHPPPPPAKPSASSAAVISEYLRRSSKLLMHELGHLYGLDHCIYYKCLMMGTGHLVEDFDAFMWCLFEEIAVATWFFGARSIWRDC